MLAVESFIFMVSFNVIFQTTFRMIGFFTALIFAMNSEIFVVTRNMFVEITFCCCNFWHNQDIRNEIWPQYVWLNSVPMRWDFPLSIMLSFLWWICVFCLVTIKYECAMNCSTRRAQIASYEDVCVNDVTFGIRFIENWCGAKRSFRWTIM